MFSKNIFPENMFSKNIFPENIFDENIFGVNIFDENIFGVNIFGYNIFSDPSSIWLPYKQPLPLLSSSSGIFEVKCDRQTKRNHGPDGARNDCSFYNNRFTT